MADKTPAARRQEWRRRRNRALWTHPHITAWRALLWIRYKRVPPWRLTAGMLAHINPRPLAPERLALLQQYIKDRYPHV